MFNFDDNDSNLTTVTGKGALLLFLICAGLFLWHVTANAETMAHWANVRYANGDLIGQVYAGDYVEVLGTAEDAYRSYVYVPSLGTYGYICSVYIYGGSEAEYNNPFDYNSGYSNYTESYSQSYDYSYNNYDYSYNDYDSTYDSSYDSYSYSYEDAWVEVDISDQTCSLWVDDDLIAEDYCVTGNKYNSPTPIGEWSVYYKEANTTLRGTSPYTGEPYATPVDYWMPFCGGCGLHDAIWRSAFGGDIYETGGSYGCVNLPHWLAEKIFNYVDAGSPVIVHE